MKIILLTAICLFFALSSSAQLDEKNLGNETVGVEQLFLAKDNGEGKIGEAAEVFLTTDIPIYCIVQLTSTKPATVKMNLVAVNVQGVKADSRVITVSFKTNGRQNRVSFTGKPDGFWTAGSYRIDIFIDDKLAAGQKFEIKNSPSEIQKAAAQIGSFIPPKPKPSPKIVRRPKKN